MDNLHRPKDLPDYDHVFKKVPFLLRSERKTIQIVFRMVDWKGYLSIDEFRQLPIMSQHLLTDMLRYSLASSVNEVLARIRNKQITIKVVCNVMDGAEQKYGKGHAFCELALYFHERFKIEKSILERVIGP